MNRKSSTRRSSTLGKAPCLPRCCCRLRAASGAFAARAACGCGACIPGSGCCVEGVPPAVHGHGTELVTEGMHPSDPASALCRRPCALSSGLCDGSAAGPHNTEPSSDRGVEQQGEPARSHAACARPVRLGPEDDEGMLEAAVAGHGRAMLGTQLLPDRARLGCCARQGMSGSRCCRSSAPRKSAHSSMDSVEPWAPS